MTAQAKFKKPLKWDIESLARYVSDIVAKESGNVLGDNQISMVINRIKKRLIDLNGMTPEQYFNHLEANYNREATHLVSLLTTHHTFFFREFCHFEYLLNDIDNIVNRVRARGDKTIRVLSAACSRGQEVYSLSMLFNHHLKNYPDISYEILGTDIDPESVKIAKNGVYPYNEVKSIPKVYLNGNWQRGTGDIARFAKIKEHLKKGCSFDVMNLLSPEDVIKNKKFDIIMCRNVFIYFDLKDVEKIVGNFKQYLHKDALFITGLSESLKSIKIEKQTHAPSVYCFDPPAEAIVESETADVVAIKPSRPAAPLIPSPIKILAVDDSSSVLKLLTKIFSSDPQFELVGTAMNGLEAEEFLKNNKVDAMTLDIHMPEMDGVEYLKKNYKKGHPHVVVVSSASREDTRYAQQTLKYGAADFVEKPALNNIAERAEEIKNKIKMSFLNAEAQTESVDKSFLNKFEIKNTDHKARLFVASFSDREKVKATLKELKGDQPPVILFFEGNGNFLEIIKEEFSDLGNVKTFNEETVFESGSITLCDLKSDSAAIGEAFSWDKVSLSVFGIVSEKLKKMITENGVGQVLIEDNGSINKEIKEVATDIFPWTSFAHVGTEFLAKLD